MRIYDGEFSIGSILEQCRADHPVYADATPPSSRIVEGVDIEKLSSIVQRIPVESIRQRRQRLNSFYEEVLVTADVVRGISFHSCLMILAHYNVISDSKSLRLEEFLRRRARMQRVEETVRRNTVIGFFDTLYWSRRFRRRIDARKSSRMTTIPQLSVPEIFVDDQDQDSEEGRTTPQETEEFGSADSPSMLSPSAHRRGTSSPSAARDSLPRIETDLADRVGGRSSIEWSSVSPTLSPRGSWAQTMSSYGAADQQDESGEEGGHSRQASAMSVQDVVDSLGNSAWGESLRRSFSQRQSNEQ